MPLTVTKIGFAYEKSCPEMLDKIQNLRKCSLFLHGKHSSQTPPLEMISSVQRIINLSARNRYYDLSSKDWKIGPQPKTNCMSSILSSPPFCKNIASATFSGPKSIQTL